LDLNIGFNISKNTSKIIKLDNSNLPEFLGYETGSISGDVGQTIQILKVGESVEAFRMYQHKYNTNGSPVNDTEDANGDGFVNDLDMYEDVNKDGIINENDLVVDKKAAPDVMMGLTSNLRYKKFDLSMTFRANLGNYVYNNVSSNSGYFDRLTDRVTNNIHKSAFKTNFKAKQLKSNYYLEDASFLRLDNISLSYTLNKGKFFETLRIYTTVQNVLTITGYSGLDPEGPQFHGGIDNSVYPVSTTYLLGLNISF
jgi:iron complex outermembrane receptor protein